MSDAITSYHDLLTSGTTLAADSHAALEELQQLRGLHFGTRPLPYSTAFSITSPPMSVRRSSRPLRQCDAQPVPIRGPIGVGSDQSLLFFPNT